MCSFPSTIWPLGVQEVANQAPAVLPQAERPSSPPPRPSPPACTECLQVVLLADQDHREAGVSGANCKEALTLRAAQQEPKMCISLHFAPPAPHSFCPLALHRRPCEYRHRQGMEEPQLAAQNRNPSQPSQLRRRAGSSLRLSGPLPPTLLPQPPPPPPPCPPAPPSHFAGHSYSTFHQDAAHCSRCSTQHSKQEACLLGLPGSAPPASSHLMPLSAAQPPPPLGPADPTGQAWCPGPGSPSPTCPFLPVLSIPQTAAEASLLGPLDTKQLLHPHSALCPLPSGSCSCPPCLQLHCCHLRLRPKPPRPFQSHSPHRPPDLAQCLVLGDRSIHF